jgi:hypothetical protein
MNQVGPVQIQATEPDSADEEFEKLRQQFHVRLRREQTQLTSLTGALGSAKIDSALALADIGAFAHRLRGAALVFGFPEIGALAKALELAAAPAAPDENGQRDDPSVEASIQALATILAEATGPAEQCAPPAKAASC